MTMDNLTAEPTQGRINIVTAAALAVLARTAVEQAGTVIDLRSSDLATEAWEEPRPPDWVQQIDNAMNDMLCLTLNWDNQGMVGCTKPVTAWVRGPGSNDEPWCYRVYLHEPKAGSLDCLRSVLNETERRCDA